MEPFNTFRDIIPVTCNRIEAPHLKIPLYILSANHSCSLQEVVAPISIFKYLMVLKTWLSGTIYLNSGCLEWVLLNFWAPSVPRLYHSSVWVVAVCVLFSSSFLVHVPWFQGKEIWFCEPRQLSCTLDIPQICLGCWPRKMHLYYWTAQGTFLSQAVTDDLSSWVVRTALDTVLVR